MHGTILGDAEWPQKWARKIDPLNQAGAYFQWLNAAISDAPPSRPLLLNMDETAIVRHTAGLRGTVVKASSKVQAAVDRSSLSDRRCCVSFLACIADDVKVQAKLPQVLLGNHHVFTLQVLRALGDLPGNVTLWRQKSAWNCHATMRRWLTLLAESLGQLVHERYVILVVDVHPSHIDESIFLHARRCGVRLVYLPAKLTWLLQPCDTHVFAVFKRAVWKAWQREKAQQPNGTISTEAWLQLVCEAIQKVCVQATWRHAFHADGLLDNQVNISPKLLEALGFGGSIALPKRLPTAEQALCIFPAGRHLDIEGYLSWQTKAERKKRTVADATLGAASASGLHVQPGKRVPGPTYKGRLVRTLD